MFEYFIYHYGTQIIAAILCAIFGCLGYAIKQLAVKYINDDTKRAIARVAVQFVEQVWNTLHGADKLAKALETAEALLKKKGIDFDAEEMQILIEAAVAEFNEAFKKPLTAESLLGAVGQIFSFPILQSTANLPAGKSGDTNTKHTADEEHLRRVRICSVWYARRDSNPQPSEPESDALSIEPLAHFIDSLCIIPTFFIFVKGCAEKYFLVFRPCSAKTVVFSEYMWYNSEKC